MGMRVSLILGYLHHARSIKAIEQLEDFQTQRLLHLAPRDRQRALVELQRLAEGAPELTPAERQAAKKAEWDQEWARLRGYLGTPGRGKQDGGLGPGDRFVIPAW